MTNTGLQSTCTWFEHAAANFRRDGIAVARSVATSDIMGELGRLLEPLWTRDRQTRPGVRRVLQREPAIASLLSRTQLAHLVSTMLGPRWWIVRAVAFTKDATGSNWMVPWHQDATISVRERRDVAGFGPWSLKDGEHHCQPSPEVLESIVTFRLHIDPCPADAGPLRVLQGTHLLGLVPESTIPLHVSDSAVLEPEVSAGDVVITSPLAIHSSGRSLPGAGRRRVLHLDCCNQELPGDLEWAERVTISEPPRTT